MSSLYIEGTKNEIVDEHELARGQNQTLQIYRGPKMQKDEDMLLQVHGIRLNRHSDLAEDSGEHGAIGLFSSFASCVDQLVCQTIAASRAAPC